MLFENSKALGVTDTYPSDLIQSSCICEELGRECPWCEDYYSSEEWERIVEQEEC